MKIPLFGMCLIAPSFAKQRCNCLPEAKCEGQVWACRSGNVAAALPRYGRCELALSSESLYQQQGLELQKRPNQEEQETPLVTCLTALCSDHEADEKWPPKRDANSWRTQVLRMNGQTDNSDTKIFLRTSKGVHRGLHTA